MAAGVITALIPELGGLIDKVSTLLATKTSTPFVGGGLSADDAAKLTWPGSEGQCEMNIHRGMVGASDLDLDIGVSWNWGGNADGVGAFITNAKIYANINSEPWDLTSATVTGSFGNPLNIGDADNPIAQIDCYWTFDWALYWPSGHMETTNYACTIRGNGDSVAIHKA